MFHIIKIKRKKLKNVLVKAQISLATFTLSGKNMVYPVYTNKNDPRLNSDPNFCRLANVICKTRDKGRQEKSRISCRCRDKVIYCGQTKTVPQKSHDQVMLKMSSIWDLKRPTAPKNSGQFKHHHLGMDDQSISWLLHYLLNRADETEQGRDSCPRLQFLAFILDSIMSLSR